MRILFGPEHDGPHIDPDTPGAYEWWYFDAISDDGRYALVAIWFHGSPMSSYYKAVVDGKNPLPRDWCGVFFSLHEKVKGRWRERAYAYNLYRVPNRPGEIKKQWFRDAPLRVRLGNSELEGRYADRGRFIGHTWDMKLDEPGLWRGRTRAELEFRTICKPLELLPIGEKGNAAEHSWVCVAPVCRVSGVVTLPGGNPVGFSGEGYHDHNFGRLPWQSMDAWYWGRGTIRASQLGGEAQTLVFYAIDPLAREAEATLLLFDSSGNLAAMTEKARRPDGETMVRNAYGLHHIAGLRLQDDPQESLPTVGAFYVSADFTPQQGLLAEGPFYRRLVLPIQVSLTKKAIPVFTGQGEGIGEVFQPARLCGPVASRAMWTRIRRRS